MKKDYRFSFTVHGSGHELGAHGTSHDVKTHVDCAVVCSFESLSVISREEKEKQVLGKLLELGKRYDNADAKWKWDEEDVKEMVMEEVRPFIKPLLDTFAMEVIRRHKAFRDIKWEETQGEPFNFFGDGLLPSTEEGTGFLVIFEGIEEQTLFPLNREIEKKDEERSLKIEIYEVKFGLVKWKLDYDGFMV